MAKFIGDLEETCLAILEKTCSVILEKTCSAFFGEKCVSDLEKHVRQKRWRFGETCLAIWRNMFDKNIGDLEKRGRRSYGNFVLEFVMK